MNIVYLTNQFSPNAWSGLGTFVDFMTEQLGKENRLWICTNNPGSLPVHEQRGNVTVQRPVRSFLKRFLRRRTGKGHYTLSDKVIKAFDLFFNNLDCYCLVRRNLTRDRYQVVVAHDFMHGLAALMCRLFLKLPIVYHVHFVYSLPPRGLRDRVGPVALLERALARHARTIIVATDDLKALMVKHGWDAAKIQVVPLCNVHDLYERFEVPAGADLLHRIERLRTQLRIGPREKVIVYVGRLVPHKGVFGLIAAMRSIVERLGQVKLVLVGEGHHRQVERMVASLGLEEHVHSYNAFLDHQEVLCHYLLADLCVFPSVQEPFGLVALEAMTVGKPVVLGSGFSRIFEGSREAPSAVFVDPHHPAEIADAVVELLQDPAEATAMAHRARAYVRDRFRRDQVVALTLETYRLAATGS